MAFRSQTAIGLTAILLAASPAASQPLRYQVRHNSPLKKLLLQRVEGTLTVDDSGIRFEQAGKKKKLAVFAWKYREIQQLLLAPDAVTVWTFEDSRWKLGADRVYRFEALHRQDFRPVYDFLKSRLDGRLIAALADESLPAEWEVPAKHKLGLTGGSHGVLRFGKDWISYQTSMAGDSRTWRFEDVENINSSHPFALTITTRERSKSHYGGFRDFHFQLKEPLEEARLQRLWLMLHEGRQLNVLRNYRQEHPEP